jgi:hypothetical protein
VVQQHQGTPYARTLGHVKLEKIAHLAEAWARVELGRRPRAMPRGPADFDLLKQVIDRGRELNAFDAPPREGSEWGYQFTALPELDALADRYDELFAAHTTRLDRLLGLLLPLKSRPAEIIATLYAVENDLRRTGTTPDDEEIFAAFHAFHPQKEHFKQETLGRWLAWMREHGIVPDGTAKPTVPATPRAKPPALPAAANISPSDERGEQNARPSTASPAITTYDAAATLLAERRTLTNSELQAALGLDAAAARALLKGLVAAGAAHQEGERRGTRYVWAGRVQNGATQLGLRLGEAEG